MRPYGELPQTQTLNTSSWVVSPTREPSDPEILEERPAPNRVETGTRDAHPTDSHYRMRTYLIHSSFYIATWVSTSHNFVWQILPRIGPQVCLVSIPYLDVLVSLGALGFNAASRNPIKASLDLILPESVRHISLRVSVHPFMALQGNLTLDDNMRPNTGDGDAEREMARYICSAHHRAAQFGDAWCQFDRRRFLQLNATLHVPLSSHHGTEPLLRPIHLGGVQRL